MGGSGTGQCVIKRWASSLVMLGRKGTGAVFVAFKYLAIFSCFAAAALLYPRVVRFRGHRALCPRCETEPCPVRFILAIWTQRRQCFWGRKAAWPNKPRCWKKLGVLLIAFILHFFTDPSRKLLANPMLWSFSWLSFSWFLLWWSWKLLDSFDGSESVGTDGSESAGGWLTRCCSIPRQVLSTAAADIMVYTMCFFFCHPDQRELSRILVGGNRTIGTCRLGIWGHLNDVKFRWEWGWPALGVLRKFECEF